jgi:OmpA-OmpF porin, OOP family
MKLNYLAATAVLVASATAGQALALTRSPILDKGSISAMRAEVDQRYEAALAATRSAEIIRANDTRFTWASEAKVACGIAIGFLKTKTVDEDSINKCDDYTTRMGYVPPPPPPPPAPAPVAVAAPCTIKLPQVFYFEWDVDRPPAEAADVAAATAQQMQACGWRDLKVSGHADKSGSDTYNAALSERRARNVADLLVGAGVGAGVVTVEAFGETMPAVDTPDGVREPLNRRVEVTTSSAQ